MNARKKKLIAGIGAVLALTLLAGGVRWYQRYHQQKVLEEEKNKIKKTTGTREMKFEQDSVTSGYSENGKNRYLICPAEETIWYWRDYFIAEEHKASWVVYERGENERSQSYRDYEKAEIQLRSYGEQEVIKTVDIKEAFDKDNGPYRATRRWYGPVKYNNRNCLITYGIVLPAKTEDIFDAEECTLLIDIESNELYKEGLDFYMKSQYRTEAMVQERKNAEWKFTAAQDYLATVERDKGSKIGAYIDYDYGTEDGQPFCDLIIPIEDLPEENEKLYSEFPALKEYHGKEGEEVHILLFEIPTNEEILEMILPEGEGIDYEKWIVEDTYSIDGQEHPIKSIDDYYYYTYGVHRDEAPTEEFMDEY